MQGNYWSKVMNNRLSRRRALAATGGAALGAAFLAACGGEDTGGDSTGLVSEKIDTTKSAKRGGVFKDFSNADMVRGFDPHLVERSLTRINIMAYQLLVRSKPIANGVAKQDDLMGDYAASWEYSPDKLKVILKMQDGIKWDARTPTSGRAADATDVAYTWQRYAKSAAKRVDLANAVSPQAPIINMTATDAKTLVIDLAFPYPDILPALAGTASGAFYIIPKEAESGFDLRTDQRGSGAFVLKEYVPSARLVYERNPNFYNASVHPWVDVKEMPIIPEYSAGLAQFKAGNIHVFPVSTEDIINTKKENPELSLYQGEVVAGTWNTFWGFREDPRNYFRDSRIRQAFALSQDRDLYIDAIYNVGAFESQGLPMETRWSNGIISATGDWWLDPKSKEFGENSKYFTQDIAEAKKLLAAAGHANGFDYDANYVTGAYYDSGGIKFDRVMEVILGMAQDAGMRYTVKHSDPNTEWRPLFFDAKGDFVGLANGLNSAGSLRNRAFAILHPEGSQFRGGALDGAPRGSGDPYVMDLAKKIQGEFDAEKAKSMFQDIVRYDAKMQYNPYVPGGASSFGIGWPAVGNLGVFTEESNKEGHLFWLDQTKAPFKSA